MTVPIALVCGLVAVRGASGAATRVVIAEDHVLLADGLARLLAAHQHDVVATVDTEPGLIASVDTHRPDVAVVDVRLPPTFTDEGLRPRCGCGTAPVPGSGAVAVRGDGVRP